VPREVITGSPNGRYISTGYVERQNLTMRMGMRRFTRLTNGLNKELENHVAANALYFVHTTTSSAASDAAHDAGNGGRHLEPDLERGRIVWLLDTCAKIAA
jgi:hypothetical protein